MSSAVSDASNHLGFSLLKGLSEEEKGNVFISPFSLSTALAMLHCAARGETRQEMTKVFGYEDVKLANDDVATAFSHLLEAFENLPKSCVLTCANSIAIEKTFSVKDEYKALLKKSFKASPFEADFFKDSQKAIKDINLWVKGKTNGKIPQLLNKLPPLTVAVLLNAIYFKGTWLNKFEERSTRKETFYNDGKKGTKVQMMQQTARFGYAERESFTVLQLPYVGESIAMMVLLPKSMDGVGELELQLTPEFFKTVKKELRQMKVKVSLPKFKFEYSKSMVEVLKSLGMLRAFGDGCDLSGLNDSSALFVAEVIHKAVVEVNEEGSEAAAATAVVVALRSVSAKPRIPDFIVDHPFLFTIFDTRNDAILFLGKVKVL